MLLDEIDGKGARLISMCVVVVVIVLLYFVLFLLARKEKPTHVPAGVLMPFYQIAFFLYKRICAKGIPIVGQRSVRKDLERLHPGENREIICTDYYIGKLAMSLVICLLGAVLGLSISIKTEKESVLQGDGTIVRGSYEEEPRELDLAASFADGKERYFSVQVESRQLSEQELNDLCMEFEERLPKMILGENDSLQEVTKDLVLEESYEGYPFSVEWHSNVPDIITAGGKVYLIEEQSATVLLTAEIFYGDASDALELLELPVCVVQPLLTEEERIQHEMEALLSEAEMSSRLENTWQLPESYRGQAIRWSQITLNYGMWFWLAALVIAILIYFVADKDIHDSLMARRTVMKRAYPDVVQKLVLYMGAGLTVRGAFQRIGSNYEQEKKLGKEEKPIYEEILYACRELQSGVSEGAVYEHFGKRTGLREYVRLSTLLVQNLKKGNNTLLQRLREEADKACTEQLQNSRRLGEEASTKLLFPMVLMLIVVMLLIMIPAFSSVGI